MKTPDFVRRTGKGLLTGLAVTLLAFTLAGCQADSDSPINDGGNGGTGPGPADLTNCAVPVATICVLGGDEHGHGLVEELLAPTGPLGPIAGEINVDNLTAALTTMLTNDDGSLAGLLTGLLAEGQLQEGLQLLLLGENGSGGLADSLQDLLLGDDEGGGLVGLLGPEGVLGLVQALLLDGTSTDCQAPLGTLCLVAGEGTDQQGLLDLLLLEGGVLASLSDQLTQEQLVAILGDTLESNGSLADLVTGLIAEGQLAEGLQALLIGDPDAGVQSGLLQTIQATLGGLGGLVEDLIGVVGSLLGLG